MKQSKILRIVMASLLMLLTTSLHADIKKGQKTYLKKCKRCHGNGTKGAAMKSQEEWTDAFADEAYEFKEWHEDTRAEKFVNSKRFDKKYAPHLKDFLHHYANDSGNVPSCG